MEGKASSFDKGSHEAKLDPVLLQELIFMAVPHVNDVTECGEG